MVCWLKGWPHLSWHTDRHSTLWYWMTPIAPEEYQTVGETLMVCCNEILRHSASRPEIRPEGNSSDKRRKGGTRRRLMSLILWHGGTGVPGYVSSREYCVHSTSYILCVHANELWVSSEPPSLLHLWSSYYSVFTDTPGPLLSLIWVAGFHV